MTDQPDQLGDLAHSPLRAVLDAFPYGAMIYGPSQNLLFANTAALRALDYAKRIEEASGEQSGTGFPFIDPATAQILPPDRTPVSRALRGETLDAEPFLILRSGTADRFWIEVGAYPVRDSAGGIAAAVFTFRSIAERKKREWALEAEGTFHGIVYHENLAGVMRGTLDGRILDCNDAILRMLGYRSKQELLVQRAPQIYYDPADGGRVLALLSEAHRLSEFEVCLRRQNGSRCWVLLNARLLDPSPGQGDATIVAIVIDITERRIHEETLRQSEQRFAAFMHHLPGIAFIKTPQGKYVYYNDASWTLFGVRPADIVGKTDAEIWPSEDAAHYRRSDASVLESGRPEEFLEPVTHPDGVHSWLIYKFPILEDGKVALVGGVGIDITERTILIDQLAQARKMEALGRLAGGVAHDFNNLLTVIAGYGQLALESIGNVPPERLSAYMREILDSSRRASGLTGQLLAFSRNQVLQPKILDLGALLRGMDRLLQRIIGEHVDVTVEVGPEECFILADPNQIEQAIMNLAVNARDAMPLGGTLQFRCERVPVSSQESEMAWEVLLEIRDDGVGMDESVRSQIFDPFFTSKQAGKGTGLGLSTVYGVVSQAKGRIEVESSPGAGTVFRLYFPFAEGGDAFAPVPARTDVARAGSALGGLEKVLLVEDEEAVRALVETILKRLGYGVFVADGGAAALRIWAEFSGVIDVLLTDVIMPQMSGGQLAHRLREKNPRLRVLFMSGYTDDMIASHGVLAGETQLIQKPFTADALSRKLRAVLDA